MTLQEILYLFNDLRPKLMLGERIDNPKIREFIHQQLAPVILGMYGTRRAPPFHELTKRIDFCVLCFTAGYNFRKEEEQYANDTTVRTVNGRGTPGGDSKVLGRASG